MLFSIIYSVDVPYEESIRPYLPTQRRLFEMTEGDEQYDYGYLGGVWSKGKHRKLCGILNRKQFDRFIQDTGLFAEDIETLGSLGGLVPGEGTYLGILPAVSFRSDDPIAIQSAYVTPFPWNATEKRHISGLLNDHHQFITLPLPEKDLLEQKAKEHYADMVWNRIRSAMISVYGS